MIDGGQLHAVIEPGKKISMWKFRHITGTTGAHVLRPTAKYMKYELTEKLPPCEICAQAKRRQVNVPKKKMKQVPSRPGYRVFIDISSFKHANRVTEIRQPIQVQSHLEMSGILVQLGHIQCM